MTEKNSTKIKESITENGSKIDAIKELIFGENMEAYESEFKTLKTEIEKQKKELEELLYQVRKELLQNMDNLNTDLNIRITYFEDTLKNFTPEQDHTKMDKKTLGEMLIKLGERISK